MSLWQKTSCKPISSANFSQGHLWGLEDSWGHQQCCQALPNYHDVIWQLFEWQPAPRDPCEKDTSFFFFFLGKGSLMLANQVQEQCACWVLFSIFPPLERKLWVMVPAIWNITTSMARSTNSLAEGHERRWEWQPNVLAWANAASKTLSSKLFGCQMCSLSK